VSRRRTFKVDRDAPAYAGPYRSYDIIKEGVLALLAVAILTVGLAALFGSPDERALTIKNWATANPADFVQTAATELNGTSGVAGYGPPYNNTPGVAQKLGPFALPDVLGARIPLVTANAFVLNPLRSQPGPQALDRALATYVAAPRAQQLRWATNYANNAGDVKIVKGTIVMPRGAYGPVATLMRFETQIARSGALDQALISGSGFYTTDYTKPELFLADGQWFGDIGAAQHLGGDQWGMMNETNSYPGQAWLWLYTLLYQVPPFSTSWAGNADALVWFTMIVLTALLALIPFIPGLRSIPRWTRVYRLIWRHHYLESERSR
jgi:hypothetical protein